VKQALPTAAFGRVRFGDKRIINRKNVRRLLRQQG
jgi:hypothetical protein